LIETDNLFQPSFSHYRCSEETKEKEFIYIASNTKRLAQKLGILISHGVLVTIPFCELVLDLLS